MTDTNIPLRATRPRSSDRPRTRLRDMHPASYASVIRLERTDALTRVVWAITLWATYTSARHGGALLVPDNNEDN